MAHFVWYTDIITELLHAERRLNAARKFAEAESGNDSDRYRNLNMAHCSTSEQLDGLLEEAKGEEGWKSTELAKDVQGFLRVYLSRGKG